MVALQSTIETFVSYFSSSLLDSLMFTYLSSGILRRET